MAGGVIKNKVEPIEERLLNSLTDSGKCPNYVRRMPPCKFSCPSNEDCRGYLTRIAQTDLFGRTIEQSLDEAWLILTDKNPFPAVHGRICPHPCETACNRRLRDQPLAINNLERFIGDHGIKRGLKLKMLTDEVREKRVAVVGAGPSGLSCAYQMKRRGFPVTVYDEADRPGGMLRAGIPLYRLPREVLDDEIDKIMDLGIEFKAGVRVGRDVQLQELREQYDAVYVAVGAQRGMRLDIEGEDLPGVYSGIDFLRQVNDGRLRDAGRRVLVVGGGNSAIDSSRVALRLGAEAAVVYRRGRQEMPAIPEEIWEAEEEGVEFDFLAAPLAIAPREGEDGRLEVTFIRMELGERDRSGRPRPVPVAGSEFTMVADTLIAAVSQQPDLSGVEGIGGNGWARILPSGESPLPGVFVGGDELAVGFATMAVGQGRKAARAIADFLEGRRHQEPYIPNPVQGANMRLDYYDYLPRHDHEYLPPGERAKSFDEVNLPLAAEQAIAETSRCMSCGLCMVCDRCRIYCCEEAISKDLSRPQGQVMFTDYTKCVGCGTCADVCPCLYIEMGY